MTEKRPRAHTHTYQECWFASFPENLDLKGLLHFPYLQQNNNNNKRLMLNWRFIGEGVSHFP